MTVQRRKICGKWEPLLPFGDSDGDRSRNVRFIVALVMHGHSPEQIARDMRTSTEAVIDAMRWADSRLVWSNEEMAEQRPERGAA